MERFGYPHRVTYADCTVGNHIYYGRYLELLEAARGQWFRSLGKSFADWQAGGLIFPVLEVQLNYRSPARYDEVLTIEVWVLEARGVRLNVGYRVLSSEGQVRVEGHTMYAPTWRINPVGCHRSCWADSMPIAVWCQTANLPESNSTDPTESPPLRGAS